MDSFSCLTFLNSLLKFLEILLNLRKFSDSIEEFMIKEVNRNMDHTQEINPNMSVPALIPIEKIN
jgi:hypothetical protein